MLQPALTDQLPAERGAGVSLWYIARRAGVIEWSETRILAYVRLLHAQEGFPPPIPSFRSGALRRGIHFKSRWVRFAVDAWFDGRVPPQLAEAANDLQSRRDAELLDARAAELAAA